ncbi:MAG: c-type cytochrome [Labilithrix sp.]|nr:c-type cytochrome [Labilithrix sp.]MCW5833076.1 c-type cytochrome [Labilithrix sp.]
MKKIIKRVLAGVGAVIVLLITAVIVKFYALSPKSRPAPVMSAPTNSEAVERGRYLVHHVTACVGCHSQVDSAIPGEPVVEGKLGAGRDFGEIPDSPVHIRAGNITSDSETGIGGWTDGEVARAIREGVSKDGRGLFPQMPYTTYRETLSDGDVLDIIAYLRTLKPVKNDAGKTSVSFPVSMFLRAVPKPLETAPPPAPSPSDKLARGRWLLRASSCNDCHDSVDEKMRKIEGKALAGGMKFPLANGRGYAIAPNITSDKATGIGAYSDEDVRRAIEEGKGKDGRDLYSMPWSYYKGMTREDKDALIAALREVPPIANIVPPSAVAGAKK